MTPRRRNWQQLRHDKRIKKQNDNRKSEWQSPIKLKKNSFHFISYKQNEGIHNYVRKFSVWRKIIWHAHFNWSIIQSTKGMKITNFSLFLLFVSSMNFINDQIGFTWLKKENYFTLFICIEILLSGLNFFNVHLGWHFKSHRYYGKCNKRFSIVFILF